MFNNILVFWGLAMTAILVIENMVIPTQAFVLWDNSSKWWILAIVCTIVWVAIWYWLRSMQDNKGSSHEEEDYDF
jgi:hypothetical protein